MVPEGSQSERSTLFLEHVQQLCRSLGIRHAAPGNIGLIDLYRDISRMNAQKQEYEEKYRSRD